MHHILTRVGRLGVSTMMDLAMHSSNGPVAMTAISERQGISLSYLQQIVACLRRGELLRPVRGPGGGYLLARAADKISIADIIKALESTGAPERSDRAADRGGHARMWERLHARLAECLAATSLEDLLHEGLPRQQDMPVVGRRERTLQHGISSIPVLMPIRPTSPNSVFALGTSDHAVRRRRS